MRLQNFLPLRRRTRPAPEPTVNRNRTEWPLPDDRLSTVALLALLLYRP
ncbi:hypothetical protein [Devosia sp. CN2-171]